MQRNVSEDKTEMKGWNYVIVYYKKCMKGQYQLFEGMLYTITIYQGGKIILWQYVFISVLLGVKIICICNYTLVMTKLQLNTI